MKIIDLINVTLQKEGNRILKGVSWSIEQGENWAMVGANGSGKTTLLNIIAGYSFPTEGTVQVLGETLGQTNMPLLRKRIGWVNSAFKEWLPGSHSSLEIVLSGLEASVGLYRDFDEAQVGKAGEALEKTGCSSLAQRRYSTLSQGEQQRVLIARAMVNEPMLLILDEPCVGLDPAAVESFLADLNGITEGDGSPAVVLVTHKIEEIRDLINRVMVIRDGTVLAAGKTEEVITSENMSEAFGCDCRVTRNGGRYSLSVAASGDE